jgi:hypothetical protein
MEDAMGQYDGTSAASQDSGGTSNSGSNSGSSKSRWKDSKTAGGLRAAGSSLMSSGQGELGRASSMSITPSQYKRGGKVRKTEKALVHKGERVIPKSKVKRVEKMMRKKKMRMKARS